MLQEAEEDRLMGAMDADVADAAAQQGKARSLDGASQTIGIQQQQVIILHIFLKAITRQRDRARVITKPNDLNVLPRLLQGLEAECATDSESVDMIPDSQPTSTTDMFEQNPGQGYFPHFLAFGV